MFGYYCFGIYWSHDASDEDKKREVSPIKNYITQELRKFAISEESLNRMSKCPRTSAELTNNDKVYLKKSNLLIIIATYNYLETNNHVSNQEIDYFLGENEEKIKNIFVFVHQEDKASIEKNHLSKYNLIYLVGSRKKGGFSIVDSKEEYNSFTKIWEQIQSQYNYYKILIDNLSENLLFFEKAIENLKTSIRKAYPHETEIFDFPVLDQYRPGNLKRNIDSTYAQIILYSCHSQIKILKERLEIYENYKSAKICIFYLIYVSPEHKEIKVDFVDCSKGIYNSSCCKNFVEKYLLDIKGDNESERT